MAKTLFSNSKDLMQAINKKLSQATAKTAVDVVDAMREQVERTVYDAYKPNLYYRTRQFKNSIAPIKNSDNSYTVRNIGVGDVYDQTFMNGRTVDYMIPEGQNHYKRLKGSIPYAMYDIIENGKTYTGYYHSRSGAYAAPRPYISNTFKGLKSEMFCKHFPELIRK